MLPPQLGSRRSYMRHAAWGMRQSREPKAFCGQLMSVGLASTSSLSFTSSSSTFNHSSWGIHNNAHFSTAFVCLTLLWLDLVLAGFVSYVLWPMLTFHFLFSSVDCSNCWWYSLFVVVVALGARRLPRASNVILAILLQVSAFLLFAKLESLRRCYMRQMYV